MNEFDRLNCTFYLCFVLSFSFLFAGPFALFYDQNRKKRLHYSNGYFNLPFSFVEKMYIILRVLRFLAEKSFPLCFWPNIVPYNGKTADGISIELSEMTRNFNSFLLKIYAFELAAALWRLRLSSFSILFVFLFFLFFWFDFVACAMQQFGSALIQIMGNIT